MRKRTATRDLALISVFGALICACSFISIPFLTVPLTMQLFGVYFALFALGGRSGTAAVVLYVAIGAIGLPVFSGFSGGIGRLFDATGGFIVGFVFLALAYWALSALMPSGRKYRIAAAAIATVVLYFTGTIWYAIAYLGGADCFFKALIYTVLPFIPIDALKILLAAICEDLFKKQLHISE